MNRFREIVSSKGLVCLEGRVEVVQGRSREHVGNRSVLNTEAIAGFLRIIFWIFADHAKNSGRLVGNVQ